MDACNFSSFCKSVFCVLSIVKIIIKAIKILKVRHENLVTIRSL